MSGGLVGSPPRLGEPAPWFLCATRDNPRFNFASLGGRLVVLLFVGSLSDEAAVAACDAVAEARDLFDDRNCAFFAVSTDPEDLESGRLDERLPGLRCFHDFDGAVSRRYGVHYDQPASPRLFLVDEMLRVMAWASVSGAGEILGVLRARLRPHRDWWSTQQAPVLTVPHVFEPAFCRKLINYYGAVGGTPSGFMRDVNGRTVGHMDPSFKRRRDAEIVDSDLQAEVRARLVSALAPMIERAFNFRPTRIERYIVACYDEAEQGFFRPHRDNTTSATAHRKFAVSINLNGDFTGGELRFPEFGPRTYRPPPGGATVFACGLLHEATPVTRGRRFACLPFLYDDAAAAVREVTRSLLGPAPPEGGGQAAGSSA